MDTPSNPSAAQTDTQRSDVEVAREHARVLTQALPWVKAMAGTTVVIKYGGGNDISDLVKALGLPVEFHDGLRVTTPEVMRAVSMVLSGKVNEELVLALNEHGPLAVGLSGVDGCMVRCSIPDPSLGRVGYVEVVDADVIATQVNEGYIPVIASVGVGPDGQAVNINADACASAIAQTCEASKIVFLTDVDGLYRDFSDKSSLIGRMTASDARELIESGTLSKGMIPKVRAAVEAIEGGVQRAHILNGTQPHSLVLELFTDTGIGTMITGSDEDLFRHDVASRVSRYAIN